jgi:hypothetical protein
MKSFAKLTALCALTLLVLNALPAAAQVATTGGIRGTVTDPEGGVMPGTTVRAISSALVAGQQVAIASGSGVYRFPSLPVGTYVLEASMPGFQSVRQENVVVSLGQTLNVDLQLGDVTISEEIVVVAEASQVSTVDNKVDFNLGEDFIERQPLFRDVTSMINYAPGVQATQAYGAASGAQNSYNMDGVDVSDPELGGRWILPSMDWVEEVQVAGIGADAEYGGFTGGVLNVITKSGGNEFHGDVRAYYSGGGLNSENAPEGSEGSESVKSDIDGSASVGGAIVQDALWYFASVNGRRRTVEPFFTEGAPANDRDNSERTETRFLGKLTWQASPSNKLVGMVDWDNRDWEYRFVGDLVLASASEKQESPNFVYSATWESLINNNNFLTVKLTGFDGQDDRLPYFGLDRPGREDFDTGFEWDNLKITEYKDVSRLTLDASWNLFADGLLARNDSHSFKFGVQIEQMNSDFVTHRNGGFSYFDDSYYCDSLDAYFADPFCGVYSSDWGGEWSLATKSDGFHGYAQDSWKIGPVVVNAGVRYSKYVGNFDDPVSDPTAGGSDVYDVDMWAPRLGFVWDLTGEGRSVVKAHYGVFFEGMTVTVFDREASGNARSDTVYLDYNFDTGEFDIPAGGSIEARAQMDPGIEHPSVEQVVATFEQQIGRRLLLGVDYIYRDFKDINAMVVSNVDDYDPQVTIPSPTDSPAGGASLPFFDLLEPQENLITNPDEATREYQSVVVRLRKSYSDGWAIDGSLVWSDLTGNANYGVTGYRTGFDDLNGFINADGTLPENSEWVFKLTGSVDLPWTIVLSGFFQYQTGEYWTPYVRMRDLYFNDRTTVFMTPRGSEQFDDRSVLDLRLEKTVNLGGARALSFFVDAFNVLDSDTVTEVAERWGDYYYDYTDPTDPVTNEWVQSSSFGTPLEIQAPREIRLGAKFSW